MSIRLLLLVPTSSAWVYSSTPGTPSNAADQDRTWASYPNCVVGREQSPINVVTSQVAPSDQLAATDAIRTKLETVPELLYNTGHSFQLHETTPQYTVFADEGGPGSEVATGATKGYTLVRSQRYNFYQVHWHTPSENTVDGEHAVLEAHFVHQLSDTEWEGNSSLVGSTQHLAVIAVLYDLSDTCNDDLESFWSEFPLEEGSESEHSDSASGEASSGEAAPGESSSGTAAGGGGGFWYWAGSLTTPPCTEGVTWILLKKRLTACEDQVQRLQKALGLTQKGVTFNNRVVQPLNQRVVIESPPDGYVDPLDVIIWAQAGVIVCLLVGALIVVAVGLSRRRRPDVAKRLQDFDPQLEIAYRGTGRSQQGTGNGSVLQTLDVSGKL